MTAPRMTDERMTDEEFDAKERLVLRGGAGSLTKLAVTDEARRARAAESAALARVRRLEEALSSLIQDADEDHSSEEDSLYRTVLVDTIEAARAALSEET